MRERERSTKEERPEESTRRAHTPSRQKGVRERHTDLIPGKRCSPRRGERARGARGEAAGCSKTGPQKVRLNLFLVDELNDCDMKTERGALVKGSEQP